ncbi:MAG: SCO family protein [Candidatus Zixiibacteriota bacterium]|nr:MAG: SCO family protein [candidate division Zixibacteria bacterium]
MLNIIKNIAFILINAIILSISLLAGLSYAQLIEEDPSQLRDIDVEERLNENIPLDFTFVDDSGDSVTLGDYFHHGKPVVLMMGYYSCPMLCGLIMSGIVEAVNETSLKFGEDYQIVSVSIDPRETDLLASAKKKDYLKRIGVPEDHAGWMFLTGSESQSRGLADAIGFKYYYDESKDMYAHAAVLIILAEEGKISRYLYGIKYESKDFRMAILEASEGKIGNTIDRIILYCYHYDPDAGGYVIFAGNVMRLGGTLTLAILAVFLGILWYRDRHKKATAKKENGI